ncbi:MAG: hypothetical protein Q4G44_01960 [Alcaligenaceae bacterium]|nr:hypothetical protein [Alcaligenaceae bacterium]
MIKTVYFDMDGVLADWVSGFEALFPTIAYSEYNALTRKEQDIYRMEIDGNGRFYRELRPFTKVITALKQLKKLGYQVEILSSVGELYPERVIKQKQAWLAEHVSNDIVSNFVNKSEHKARYAYEKALLLDDRSKSVDPFLKAGGKSLIFHGCQVNDPQEVINIVVQAFEV